MVCLVPQAAAVAPAPGILVQRTYKNPNGEVLRSCYHCRACAEDFQGKEEAYNHMATAHEGGTRVQESSKDAAQNTRTHENSQAASPEEAVNTRRVLVRTYNSKAPDGGMNSRTVYMCETCGSEFDEVEQLMAHWVEPCSNNLPRPLPQPQPSDPVAKTRGPKVQVVRIKLANGEFRFVCPTCEEQFEHEAALLDHAASAHGGAWAAPGAAPGSEAERMDLLHQGCRDLWYPSRDEALRRLTVISLGSFCGVKFSIQRLGLGNAHHPFDWLRSSVAGVKHFLRNGFADFFSVASQVDVPGTTLRVYRSERHSFWHDDIARPEARAKLQRRVDRFLSLASEARDLLFVRSCATTQELNDVEDLYAALRERFVQPDGPTRRVLLVVIADGQLNFEGPVRHAELPSVVMFGQPLDPRASDADGDAYCRAISTAVDAALALSEKCDPDCGFGLDDTPWTPSAAALLTQGVRCDAVMAQGTGVPWAHCDAGLRSGYEGVSCYEEHGAPHHDWADAGGAD